MDDLIAHGLRKTRDKKSVEQRVLLRIQTAVDAERYKESCKSREVFWDCVSEFSQCKKLYLVKWGFGQGIFKIYCVLTGYPKCGL